MGVYIKGMDMPKGCYECPLMDGEYGDCKVGATGLYDPYMEDCPLTEVPEPQSEQYKKGFEDAERAFELEFARESEDMRKRNAELEVMLNAQKAISADAEWIPCSERLPKELEAVNVTWVNHNPPCYYMDIMNVPFTATGVYHDGEWYWWDATVVDLLGEYGGAYIHGIEPIDKDVEVTAWMPLPTPYKESEVE